MSESAAYGKQPGVLGSARPGQDVRFFHEEGRYDASRQRSDLLRGGSRLIRGAVCSLTGPGSRFLQSHAVPLPSADSFFEASVDTRTDLKALHRFLVDDGVGKDARYWKLAQALSAPYPGGTDEKRWVDGVLARKKGLGL